MSLVLRLAAVKAIEQGALRSLPAGTLMSRAADAIADETAHYLRRLPAQTPVIALVGPGNNGGDALLAGLRLRRRGFSVRALAIAPVSARAADAQAVWQMAASVGLSPTIVADPLDVLSEHQIRTSLFIDGLFGIGLSRPLEGNALRWSQALNALNAKVIAVDVPSGVDADVGTRVGGSRSEAIRAIKTVTLIADKPGLRTGPALDDVGEIRVADLGLGDAASAISQRWSEPLQGFQAGTLLSADSVAQWQPIRSRVSHKGSFGAVRVIGGSTGMQGAALLAARAAQCAGAGKVAIESPAPSLQDFGQPQLMAAASGQPLTGVDVLVIGCGLGSSPWAIQRLRHALDSGLSLVLDADALNLLADPAHGLTIPPSCRTPVMTPHPLEAARLLGCDVTTVQSDRIGAACSLSARFKAVVVLKGAGSVIADPSGRWAINGSGDASLATAGTGDVLAGAIGGLLAQGLDVWPAACLGTWCHGRAGENWRKHQARAGIGLSAAELSTLLRDVLNQLDAGSRSSMSSTNCP